MTQTFIANHRVEFRDTDAAGIMHFSTFVTYMEESEHALLRSIGLSVMDCEVEGEHLSWPRVSVHCDFVSPLRFEDRFDVQVSVGKLGKKSVTYRFRFMHNEQCCARGEITAVCCRLTEEGMHSVEIPKVIRDRLEKFLESKNPEGTDPDGTAPQRSADE